MIKKFLLISAIFFTTITAHAYQDYIIISDGALTDINIEDKSIIDVFPLITVMNEKNILIVHPLKPGKTRFCALKNNKSLALFKVGVNEFETRIIPPKGYEVLSIDSPTNEFEFEIDEPPLINTGLKE